MLRSARCILSDVSTGRTIPLVRGKFSKAGDLSEALSKSPAVWRPSERKPQRPRPQSTSSPSSDPPSEDVWPKKKIAYKNPLSLETAIRPAVISSRVKELIAMGEIKLAERIVLNARMGNTNIITWHTLLSEMMNVGRRAKAYKMFNDMKRRGVKPNSRTYFIMLHGLSTVKDLEKMSRALPLSHSLYEEYLELLRSSPILEKPELRHLPTMFYFDILGRAGEFQKMFDVFYDLDETGLLAPDRYVYSGLLKNLKLRTSTEKLGDLTTNEQNAVDAKLIWRRIEKDIQRTNMEIDSYCIVYILNLLSFGRPPDQQYGFDIIRTHLGLAPPGEEVPKASYMPIGEHLLQAVLELCNRAGKPRLTSYFTKEAMARGVLLDDGTLVQCLLALNTTAGATNVAGAGVGAMEESARAVELLKMLRTQQRQLPPGTKSRYTNAPSNKYGLALSVCSRCADWESACKVYTLATGLSTDQFQDEPSTPSESRSPQAGDWENVNLQALTFLARTAIATENLAHVRQCLRMLSSKGAAVAAHDPFYEAKLSELIVQMCDRVQGSASLEDEARWQALRDNSTSILKKQLKFDKLPRLEQKSTSLGSSAFLDKMDQAIDFEMAVRTRHSIS